MAINIGIRIGTPKAFVPPPPPPPPPPPVEPEPEAPAEASTLSVENTETTLKPRRRTTSI